MFKGFYSDIGVSVLIYSIHRALHRTLYYGGLAQ